MSNRAVLGTLFVLVGGGFAVGCASAGPSFDNGDLRAVLSIEPGSVTTNQQFDVRVDLTNLGEESIDLQTRGCRPLKVTVGNGGGSEPGALVLERLDLCTPLGAIETILPGATISLRQTLTTRERRGTFDLRVEFNFDEGLPALAGTLRID